MTERVEIVDFSTLQERYEGVFTRDELRRILKMKGCPVLPRKENAPYKILLVEFEEWLRQIKNPRDLNW